MEEATAAGHSGVCWGAPSPAHLCTCPCVHALVCTCTCSTMRLNAGHVHTLSSCRHEFNVHVCGRAHAHGWLAHPPMLCVVQPRTAFWAGAPPPPMSPSMPSNARSHSLQSCAPCHPWHAVAPLHLAPVLQGGTGKYATPVWASPGS
eukprot:235064-Chlamydomonas_euryale.AAC.2